ncbi:MAG: arginine deiminase-related protein, partial [candidate division NC10 bacterium]
MARDAGHPAEHRLLVCAPDHYRIAYEINPWMRLERAADPHVARVQWDALIAILEKECGATLERIAPTAGLPDMVFTANAGVVTGRSVILSRFRCPERQTEEEQFARWFEAHGYAAIRLPRELLFEGAGDLLDGGEVWFGGHGQRSDIRAYQYLGSPGGRDIVPLQLVDPRFYHLDTCLCPLTGGEVLWFPSAFDRSGRAVLRNLVPASRRIEVPQEEALRFACNAVCLGRHVVIPEGCPGTMKKLEDHGYRAHAVCLSEFIKAGGAAKCLTLALS